MWGAGIQLLGHFCRSWQISLPVALPLLSFVRNGHPILLCFCLSLLLLSVRINYRILLSTDELYNERLRHRVWKALSRRRRDNARYVNVLPMYSHP